MAGPYNPREPALTGADGHHFAAAVNAWALSVAGFHASVAGQSYWYYDSSDNEDHAAAACNSSQRGTALQVSSTNSSLSLKYTEKPYPKTLLTLKMRKPL